PLINGQPPDIQFLVPLTKTHFNFCRSLYSALINDYPAPILINYGKTFKGSPAARVGKVSGILNYLKTKVKPSQQVIIMDGFDVWYQLPFANLLTDFSRKLVGVKNTPLDGDLVVFGADKKCWPNKADTPACAGVPESPLPSDSYGDRTDDPTVSTENIHEYDTHRPRWLNSGNIIGSASTLQEIYRRANHTISSTASAKVFSDQKFLADVYGEQDLPITVDFTSSLFQTMTFSTADVIFIPEVLDPQPKLPRVVRSSLAFNRISSSIPSILHFNGPKELMDAFWPEMWWSKGRNEPTVIAKSRYVYEHGGAYTESGEFLPWSELCGGFDVHIPSGELAEGRWGKVGQA
ncbi:uncharacterized protein V1516DRAFT_621540, partial [Lipomyces oligophaga]|uniref:uncharacterized protein n=1 Tax=Lipomyces oligophaga TaxID=45792 RepID=UPI0034CD43BD